MLVVLKVCRIFYYFSLIFNNKKCVEGLATGWYDDTEWVAFKAAHWGFGSIEYDNYLFILN